LSTPVLGPAWADILVRELDRLVRLLEAYPDEADLWTTPGTTKNSVGTLALHLAGNLEHFVGAGLGQTGYVRDRPAEFGDRDVPRAEIIERIRACQETLRSTLSEIPDATLLADFPGQIPASLEGHTSAAALLAHLTWHFGWHLGQIDYHRRITVGGEAM
jgi:hypothetical protein